VNGRLSARSRPTGPGSRGGHWHDPEFRTAYHRKWRAANPEYRERENRRRTERRRQLRMAREAALPPVTFSDAIRSLVAGEVAGSSIEAVARRLAVAPRSVRIWAREERGIRRGQTIDALVATFGLDRIRSEYTRLRREGTA
jgi:hypothetical protein